MSEKYEQFVKTRLEMPAAMRPALGELVQGLFLPAFDPEACISVVLPDGGDGLLAVGAFPSNCWFEGFRGASALRVLRASAALPADTWRMLRQRLDALPRSELVEDCDSGLDGMFLLGRRSQVEGDTLRFKVWSPTPGSAAHEFFRLLYITARETISDAEVQAAIDPLHHYLQL